MTLRHRLTAVELIEIQKWEGEKGFIFCVIQTGKCFLVAKQKGFCLSVLIEYFIWLSHHIVPFRFYSCSSIISFIKIELCRRKVLTFFFWLILLLWQLWDEGATSIFFFSALISLFCADRFFLLLC